MTILDLKEKAKLLRKDLKNNLGYTAKQVSVRMSAGSALYVTIKDYKVDVEAVEKEARKYEEISYDEVSREILAGGNDFVFVDNEAINPHYQEFANKIYDELETTKKEEYSVALPNEAVAIHFIELNHSVPKFKVQIGKKKSSFQDLYTADQIAEVMTLLK